MEDVKSTAGTPAAVETTPTTTPSAAPETGLQTPAEAGKAAAVSTEATTGAAPVEGAAVTTPAAPVYNPNYKFRAFDEEKEMDEWARPLITSKEIEAKFRDLYSASHGIGKYKEAYAALSEQHNGLANAWQNLSEHVQRKDFDAFFADAKIPMEPFWEWVAEKMKYYELPPDQRKLYDERSNLARRNRELEKTKSSGDSEASKFETLKRSMRLDYVMDKPDNSKIAQEYDEGVGEDGAFRRFVASCGERIELSTGRECTAEQAFKEALRVLRINPNPPQAAPSSGNAVTPGVVTQPGSGGKPVIPNIKGSGSSPVKKKYGSIEEMRKDFGERLKSLS